jgi:hypothetical protein
LETFLITFAFVGVVTGTAVGALAGWRQWQPLKAFAVALAILVIAALVFDLANQLDFESLFGAILLGPLAAFLPTAAGFVVGRQFMRKSSMAHPDDSRP